MLDEIRLEGIQTHNLKGIDVVIPHRSLTVVTGVSGSGKSSLAFDTLYAEGQRRYVESLSTYARQFLERVEKPDVKFVSGMLPAIAIEAKNVVSNARSTVGTQTEVCDYLRLLFARIGVTFCSLCGREVTTDSPASISLFCLNQLNSQAIYICFPFELNHSKTPSIESVMQELQSQGFLSAIIDGRVVNLSDANITLKQLSRINILVDELEVKESARKRLFDSIENALRYGKGAMSVFASGSGKAKEHKFSNRFHCAPCDLEYYTPNPNHFSFNSPLGACPECQGFGRVITIDWNLVVPNRNLSIEQGAVEPFTKPSTKQEFRQLLTFCARTKISTNVPFSRLSRQHQTWILEGNPDDRDYFSVKDFFSYLEKKVYKMHVRIFLSKYRGYISCPLCAGRRLRPEAFNVKIQGQTIADMTEQTISKLVTFFNELQLSKHEETIAEPVLLEIKKRIKFLNDVGLGYLTLDRLSRTLSGGEVQRIHLATSLGSALVDTLYVLDEPSVGLHERDNALLVGLLQELKNLGNTVVVVEHDRAMIEAADQVLDLGPLGGEAGGRIMYSGPFEKLSSVRDSLTAQYFRGELPIERAKNGAQKNRSESIEIHGAREHNLKNINVKIPLGKLVVITGVSGSGKSTLIYDVLYNNYLRWRGRSVQDVGTVDEIRGFEHIEDIALIDQSPIGRTPRSNPATYLKAFDSVRKAFASTRQGRARHFGPGHFSFNVRGGRCETCEGDGSVKIEMHFLADVSVTCETCGGKRFQDKVLDIKLRGKNIYDVLQLTVHEAMEFFTLEKDLREKLSILEQVGLGYLRLGQSATTLSGGEAQRLKLAAEIAERHSDNLLYLFDEPTTGLHYYDIQALMKAFDTLLSRGHSLCVIEHNMEMIKCADYVIDLGPEGGEAGGQVVYEGQLTGLLKAEGSHTGIALKRHFKNLKR